MSFHQSVQLHVQSQESFLLHCNFPQLAELKNSSKVMKIQESHDTERCAVNNASFATGEIQVSYTLKSSSLLPLSLRCHLGLLGPLRWKWNWLQFHLCVLQGFFQIEVDLFLSLLCEFRGWTVSVKSVMLFTFGMIVTLCEMCSQ